MIQTTGFGKRFLCGLLSLFMLLSYHVPVTVLAAATEPVIQSQATLPQDLGQIELPKNLGKIQEYSNVPGAETVILIQDAHAIPDAQRSIQQLIEFFQNQFGVRHVAVEGAADELDTQIFKSFPDQKLLKETFKGYFEKGELTGSVLAALFGEKEALFHGIEDFNLYEEGLVLFTSAMRKEVD